MVVAVFYQMRRCKWCFSERADWTLWSLLSLFDRNNPTLTKNGDCFQTPNWISGLSGWKVWKLRAAILDGSWWIYLMILGLINTRAERKVLRRLQSMKAQKFSLTTACKQKFFNPSACLNSCRHQRKESLTLLWILKVQCAEFSWFLVKIKRKHRLISIQ